MIVEYNFNCSWDSEKKIRISQLLSERIILLTGTKVFKKINFINFCEKEYYTDELLENSLLLSDNKIAALQINNNMKKNGLIFEKDILLSILIPGEGQSYFDDLILKVKNIIQTN